MHTLGFALFVSLCLITLCNSVLPAATYYVDYEAGSDKGKGTAGASAWKHCPGDPAATEQPKSTKLQPGDTIIFKGGVQYRGTLILTTSGEKDAPIIFDGNTKGNFGKGRAIIDGSEPITDWKRCESADDAMRNPLWKQMFYADIKVDVSSNTNHGTVVPHRQAKKDVQAPWQRVILIDGEKRILPISQHPKPKDPFYPDLPSNFNEAPGRIKIDKAAGTTSFSDPERLTDKDPKAYENMFVAFHAGNNHTYFAKVKSYDPGKNQITFPVFKSTKTYKTTKYALFNHPRLISNPGEWAITPSEKGTSRVYILPDRLVKGLPVDVGYPIHDSGIQITNGAAYIAIDGLSVQRFAGGAGGVSVARNNPRSKGIRISNCEIRFVTGHAGIGLNYCDDVLVENCRVTNCPGWTTAIFLSRINDYKILNNYLKKNSGSGIRHYECKRGLLKGNAVIDHFGMHSSAMNVYEGCAELTLEDNYVQGVITINRNADTIIFRNNIIDGMGRSAVSLPIWGSGRTGGRNVRNIQVINNTFVNLNQSVDYSSSIFGQGGGSTPEEVIVRNNIIDRPGGKLKGVFEGNIYLRNPPEAFMGKACRVESDLQTLEVDAAKGDFRRRKGITAGADLKAPEER